MFLSSFQGERRERKQGHWLEERNRDHGECESEGERERRGEAEKEVEAVQCCRMG